MPYLVMQPRADIIAFIEKYQDRLLYATDNEFFADGDASEALRSWENTYAFDWRFFSTSDTLQYRDRKVQGLNLRPLFYASSITRTRFDGFPAFWEIPVDRVALSFDLFPYLLISLVLQ